MRLARALGIYPLASRDWLPLQAMLLEEKNKAEAVRIIAQAEADRVIKVGEAEAEAVQKKGEAE
eukprot:255415-Prorocentrum_minimum.AAC.2